MTRNELKELIQECLLEEEINESTDLEMYEEVTILEEKTKTFFISSQGKEIRDKIKDIVYENTTRLGGFDKIKAKLFGANGLLNPNEVANVAVINNEVYVLYSDPEMRKNHQGASSEWQLFTFVNGTDGWIYERDDTNSTTGNQFYYKRLGSVTNGKVYYKRYNSLAELEQEYPHGFTEPNKIGQLAVVIEQDTGGTEIRTSYFYDYRNDQWTAVSEEQSSDVYHGPFNVIVSDKPDISGLMPNGGIEPQESGIWLVETEYTVTVD